MSRASALMGALVMIVALAVAFAGLKGSGLSSFLCGAVLVVANVWVLEGAIGLMLRAAAVESAQAPEGGAARTGKSAGVAVLLFAKVAALGISTYVVIARWHMPPVPFVAAFGAGLAALALAHFFLSWRAKVR